MEMPNKAVQSGDALTASSLQWLWLRMQYSRICLNILQLRIDADRDLSQDRLDRVVALSTALEEWYRSAGTNQTMLPSLEQSDALRVKLKMSYYYHEAQLQLIGMNSPGLELSLPQGPRQRKKSLRSSIKAIIISSSTMPLEYLAQD
jgi:hypothetical protein